MYNVRLRLDHLVSGLTEHVIGLAERHAFCYRSRSGQDSLEGSTCYHVTTVC